MQLMSLGTGWVKKVKPKAGQVDIYRECIDQDGKFHCVETAHYYQCEKGVIDAAKPLIGKRVLTAANIMERGCFTLLAIQQADRNNASINELL